MRGAGVRWRDERWDVMQGRDDAGMWCEMVNIYVESCVKNRFGKYICNGMTVIVYLHFEACYLWYIIQYDEV